MIDEACPRRGAGLPLSDGPGNPGTRRSLRASILTLGGHYPEVDGVLAALAGQDASPADFEVILSDTRARRWEAAAREVGERNPAFNLTYLPVDAAEMWRARMNNAALRLSRGGLIIFLAGDFTPGPGFVSAHLAFHVDHPEREAVGIGAGTFPPEQSDGALPRWLEESGQLFGARAQDEGSVPPGFFYVANSSVKRALLDEAGEFDEVFESDTWDDYEMGVRLFRAGARSAFVPGAATRHEHRHPVTMAERRCMMRRSGEAAAQFERKYPGPHPWTWRLKQPPWRYSLAAARASLRYVVSRSPKDLERFFENTFEAQFVAGYRCEGRKAKDEDEGDRG